MSLLIENLKGTRGAIQCKNIDEANKIFALLGYNKTYENFSTQKVDVEGNFIKDFLILCDSPAILLSDISTSPNRKLYKASDVILTNRPVKMVKTIAEQLGITEYPFKIKDKNDKVIYEENSVFFWIKYTFDEKSRLIGSINSQGTWLKYGYDENGNENYFESASGYWYKKEFDKNKILIYHENNDGVLVDNRPKDVELTLEQIAEKLGIDVKNLKIVK